jgi:hypothetical protein
MKKSPTRGQGSFESRPSLFLAKQSKGPTQEVSSPQLWNTQAGECGFTPQSIYSQIFHKILLHRTYAKLKKPYYRKINKINRYIDLALFNKYKCG